MADESRRSVKMTFDKYDGGREKFNDCIFPNDEYNYDYVWSREIGWHVVRGRKLEDKKNGNRYKKNKKG